MRAAFARTNRTTRTTRTTRGGRHGAPGSRHGAPGSRAYQRADSRRETGRFAIRRRCLAGCRPITRGEAGRIAGCITGRLVGRPIAAAVPTPTPFSLDDLSLIQPGLGTVMIEYARRMSSVWFGAQAGNGDMAKYQIIEMREIQETGEITRPPRAAALKSFESSFLDPLDQAVAAQDKTKFETAYSAAIQGCNSCHGSQTSSDFPQSFKFIKVQVPQKRIWDIYAWTSQ